MAPIVVENLSKKYNNAYLIIESNNDGKIVAKELWDNEYENLINSTYDLLSEEYDLLIEIMDMSKKSEDKIKQEYEISKNLDESLKKAQTEIKQELYRCVIRLYIYIYY